MRLLYFVLISLALIKLAHATSAVETNKVDYHFVAIEHLAEQKIGKIVLTHVYQALGLNIQVSPFSGNRAQYAANYGHNDGEIMRIWSYGTENKNLIRVPTPYYRLVTSAFTLKNSGINITKASDLKDYRVARIRGVKHTNTITKDLQKVSDTSSTTGLFNLLQKERIDIALTSYVDGMQLLKKLNLEDEIMVSPALATLNLYHYIHKDQQALVSKVDLMIKQLKSNGQLAKIIASAELMLLDDS